MEPEGRGECPVNEVCHWSHQHVFNICLMSYQSWVLSDSYHTSTSKCATVASALISLPLRLSCYSKMRFVFDQTCSNSAASVVLLSH